MNFCFNPWFSQSEKLKVRFIKFCVKVRFYVKICFFTCFHKIFSLIFPEFRKWRKNIFHFPIICCKIFRKCRNLIYMLRKKFLPYNFVEVLDKFFGFLWHQENWTSVKVLERKKELVTLDVKLWKLWLLEKLTHTFFKNLNSKMFEGHLIKDVLNVQCS